MSEGRDAAGDDHFQRCGLHQLGDSAKIGSGQCAIHGYIGIDDSHHTGRLHSLHYIRSRHPTRLGPALQHHYSVLRVDTDHYCAGSKLIAERTGKARLRNGCGACNYTIDATCNSGPGGCDIANPSAKLHGGLGRDRRSYIVVDRTPLACSVQIDYVKSRGALIDPLRGHLSGVVRVDRLAIVVALEETDAFAAPDIYGWYNFHRLLGSLIQPTGEIPVDLQAHVTALFRMELDSDQIVSDDRAAKVDAI
jgi:hypothetical protein